MDKVKISKDGGAIDFVQTEKLPSSIKKFRKGPEIEGLYRFIYENDLRKEALKVVSQILFTRKASALRGTLKSKKRA